MKFSDILFSVPVPTVCCDGADVFLVYEKAMFYSRSTRKLALTEPEYLWKQKYFGVINYNANFFHLHFLGENFRDCGLNFS